MVVVPVADGLVSEIKNLVKYCVPLIGIHRLRERSLQSYSALHE